MMIAKSVQKMTVNNNQVEQSIGDMYQSERYDIFPAYLVYQPISFKVEMTMLSTSSMLDQVTC